MIRKKFSKVSLVSYLIIIGLSISILVLNIEVFTAVLTANWPPSFPIMPTYPYPRHLIPTYTIHISSLEVYFFYIIIIISCLEIFLNLTTRHHYIKYSLIGIFSIIPISSYLLVFVDPKLLILDKGVSQFYPESGFTLLYHNVSTGGIIVIILSSILIVNSIGTVFISLRHHLRKEIDESKNNHYHSIPKNRLICPHCRSAVKLEDYYCLFCSGIVHMYAPTG